VPTETLTPTQLVPDGAGLNITPLLTLPTATTLSFQNTLNVFLAIVSATTATTVTVNISSLVDGESVSSFPAVTLTETDMYFFGPYHSVLDAPGSNLVSITLSATTSVTCALLQWPGTY
jgi:hypothetical protein